MGRALARTAPYLAAFLAGVAGLAIEVLLAGWAGLVVGQGRGAALALAVWVGAWGSGAYWIGRGPLRSPRAPLWVGLASALGALAAQSALRWAAGASLATPPALAVAAGAVALAALPQGGFLPLLARRVRAREVGGLFAANLLGCVVGARSIAFDLAAAQGRTAALLAAAAAALSAGLLGWRAPADGLRADGFPAEPPGAPASVRPGTALRRAGIVLGLASAWATGAEWVGLRLGALWFGGLAPALSGVLAASLVSLAAGAALLPPILARDARGPAQALVLALAGGCWTVLGPGPDWLADPRARPFLGGLLLVGPLLAPLGALAPLLHRTLPGESGRRLAGLLVHEAWGAPLGVALAHVLLVPRAGCGGTLGVLSLLAAGALLLGGPARRWALVAAVLAPLAALALGLAREPALASPALSRPDFEVLAFREDEEFAVSVVRDGLRGELTLLTDEFRATAVGDDYLYMRVLGHLPLLLHPSPRRVAVLAFGTGTTAGAVALHPEVERLEVLEISRAVLDSAGWFEEVNHGVLRAAGGPGARVALRLGDGRRTLARTPPGSLDVLTMEPLLPDSPAAVFLYTREFYALARRALAPDGLLCQWVPPHALRPETFEAVVDAFARSFPWSGVLLFGTQVILVGGESLPALPARGPAPGSPLEDDLSRLGLADGAGVAARFVTSGASWPAVPRPLTDDDPWVIYVPRPPRGVEALAWAPLNLARLRAREESPPLAWRVALGAAGERRLADVRRIHRMREAWLRSALGGRDEGLAPAPDLPDPGARLEELDALAAREVEARALAREVRTAQARLAGIAALGRGDGRAALDDLTRLVELAPERADGHLFVALAAARLGQAELARAAARRAFELCPRLLETGPGRLALELGLPAPLAALGAK